MVLTPLLMAHAPGGEMVKMLEFLFIIVELSCETSHGASNSTGKERAMHYGSEIDDYGANISPYHYFSAGGCEGPVPMFSAESGAVWRDLGLPKRSEARREANES